MISIASKAANGITAKTNVDECTEGTEPSVSDSQTILSPQELQYFSADTEFGLISITDFVPTKSFSQFWLYSKPEGVWETTPEFVIYYVTIEDVTNPPSPITNNIICCNQNYSTITANPLPFSGTVPQGSNSGYSYHWDRKYSWSSTWETVGYTREFDYGYSVTNNTQFRRIVIATINSQSEISESNIVTISTNVNSGTPWYTICCDQSFIEPSVPESLETIEAPPENFGNFRWYGNNHTDGIIGTETSYSPPKIYETTEFTFWANEIGGGQGDVWSSVTIEIQNLFLDSQNYNLDESICSTERIDILGELSTSNEANLIVSTSNSISLHQDTHLTGDIHLRIEDCTTQAGARILNEEAEDPYVVRSKFIIQSNSNQVTSEQLISISPNPSDGNITLSFSESLNTLNSEIIVYDNLGNIRYSKLLITSDESINLSLTELPADNYIIKFTNSDIVIVDHIIIQ